MPLALAASQSSKRYTDVLWHPAGPRLAYSWHGVGLRILVKKDALEGCIGAKSSR